MFIIKFGLLKMKIRLTALFNNTRTLEFKTQLMNAFFAAVNHNNYDDNQLTLKKKETKWIEIY